MNIIFFKVKNNTYNSTLLDVFSVKSLDVEILSNGTVYGSMNDPLILIFACRRRQKLVVSPQQFVKIIFVLFFKGQRRIGSVKYVE